MAQDFDGTDDYIEAALGANYDVPKTLACWFNSDLTNSRRNLICLATGLIGSLESPVLALQVESTATIRAATSSATGQNSAVTTDTFTLANWHHAAARFAGAASRIAYLDGVASVEQTTSRATGGNLDSLTIGRGAGGTYNPSIPFNGRIAEVGVWDVALSTAEIASLARGFKPSQIRPDKLLFYLPFVRDVQDVRSGLTYTTSGPVVAVHPRRIA
jgi:hypothetical protein